MNRGNRQPGGKRKLLPFIFVVAAMLFFASGCSVRGPDLAVDTARELQSRLPEVRQAAAGNDYALALSLLDKLETDVDRAAGDGAMSFARHQGISSALNGLRAELQRLAAAAVAAVAQQPTPEGNDAVEPPGAALPEAGIIGSPAPGPLPPPGDSGERPQGKDNAAKGDPGKAGQGEKKKDS
jgi:hypothetical protein